MSEKKRFIDKGTFYWHFWDKISVKCPTCSNQALVLKENLEARMYSARVSCIHCGYNDSTSSTSWKGAVIGHINRPCPYCGRLIKKQLNGPKYLKFAHIKCTCGLEFDEPIDWEPVYDNKASDPFFGLPLWFSGYIFGNELWAYNSEHLKFLKSVVEADLREIQGPKRTLSVSLPKWILARNNRKEILKMIEKISKL